ncbi:MAG TPA: aspartate/tyrosine/aromatic aminotransferase, partial [Propionibacteriaceae bacterium]|nr:aspartate/tyrosine/aromatic aminotransferase [Propionibacteriaceae bacterium]
MDHNDVLTDMVHRVIDAAEPVLRGIDHGPLHARPANRGSSIAWLVWHAARQMDAQLAPLSGRDQVWSVGGWASRLGIPRGPEAIGFGDTSEDVAKLVVDDPALLL